jgi:hypothetical protein
MVCRFTRDSVDAQRVEWIPEQWTQTFTGYETTYNNLTAHSEQKGGITRSFIHDRASGDPVALFLMAMAWGYGTVSVAMKKYPLVAKWRYPLVAR